METSIISAPKQAQALQYYAAGWRADDIALALGVASGTVRGWIRAGLAQAAADRAELAADYIERELAGLDALERLIFQDAADPDAGAAGRAAAARVILELKARRAKYLGLDKPQEIKTTLTLEQLVSGTITGTQ